MPNQIRITKCPLCGNQLGMLRGDEWTPMTLDEYRDYYATQTTPHPRTNAAPDACIVCWNQPDKASDPRLGEPTLQATVRDGVPDEPAPSVASDAEIVLAEQLRHQLEERYLGLEAALNAR
jgi:hypothetical protein